MNLSQDLIKYLFSFLGLKDLKECRLVCKRFTQICDGSLQIKFEVGEKTAHRLDSFAQGKEYLSLWPQSSRNKFTWITIILKEEHIDQALEIIAMLPNLTNFVIHCQQEEVPTNIHSFFNSLPKTATNFFLRIDSYDIDFLQPFTSLTKLKLAGCDNLKGNVLNSLPTSLVSLMLWYNKNMDNLQGVEKLTQLRELQVTSCDIKDEDLKLIPTTLRKFYIFQVPYITKDGLNYLPSTLLHLEVHSRINLDGVQLPKTLKELHISRTTFTISSFNFPPHLEVLDIDSCDYISGVTFAQFPSKLKSLYVAVQHFPLDLLFTIPSSITFLSVVNKGGTMEVSEADNIAKKFKELGRNIVIIISYLTPRKEWQESEYFTWLL